MYKTYEEALASMKPKEETHFYNGWHMWPEYWSSSTIDWRKGFRARKDHEMVFNHICDKCGSKGPHHSKLGCWVCGNDNCRVVMEYR